MTVAEYLQLHTTPEKADKILAYLRNHSCSLKITRPRKSKRGDFRFGNGKLSISVNQDTNSFRFLFTLIHEMAHLKNYLEYGTKVSPHGKEWKADFQKVFSWFKMQEEFSKDIEVYKAVLAELNAPKACSGVNHGLERAFMKYDALSDKTLLADIPIGSAFIFREIQYQKLEDRRTRVMCLNIANKRKYIINKGAEVKAL
jgi:SprT protein